MNISQSALKDGEILEAKISALIDEFEQKHQPIQTNVLTRFRKYDDEYKVKKGGAAQIILHDASPYGEFPVRLEDSLFIEPIKIIYYSDIHRMDSDIEV